MCLACAASTPSTIKLAISTSNSLMASSADPSVESASTMYLRRVRRAEAEAEAETVRTTAAVCSSRAEATAPLVVVL
jgi:hypothetical protein